MNKFSYYPQLETNDERFGGYIEFWPDEVKPDGWFTIESLKEIIKKHEEWKNGKPL